jgi:hypothetical protein
MWQGLCSRDTFQGYIPCERHSLKTFSINILVLMVELMRSSLRIPSLDPSFPFLSFLMHLFSSSTEMGLWRISCETGRSREG